ncbi:TPA: hypothetical protein ACGXNJ_003412 [Bacillus cereus]
MPIKLNRWVNTSQDRNFRNKTNENWDNIERTHNDIEQKSEQAIVDSTVAKEKAIEANDLSHSVQTQLDTIVINNGQSDAEVLQARTDENGEASFTIKERIDKGFKKNNTQIGNINNQLTKEKINALSPPVPLIPCKGDSVADDSIALQNLIDFVAENNGVLFLPYGIYRTTRTIYIKKAIVIEGAFEKGDVGTGSSKAKGAMIKYDGTGTAIEVKTDDGSFVYGFKINNIRIGSTGNADKGISFIGVTESDVLEVHINGGFNVGLHLNNTTITNIEHCDFSANNIGILFDYNDASINNTAINIYGCNFWKNEVAHIKIFKATSVNIFGNWFEYSQIGLWIDNGSLAGGGVITNLKFYDNSISVGNSNAYPNSKSIKVTASNPAKQITVRNFIVRENLLYNSGTDYVIQIQIAGAASGAYVYGKISDNLIWGAQTSAINADTGNVSLEVSGNDSRNGYYGSPVAESSGTGKYIGITKQYDYLQVNGALRLGQGTQSSNPAAGDIYWSTTTGTPRMYDGSKNQILAYAESGSTNARPTTGLYVPRFYFDTTLGKPIWWNGTAWKDALGTIV